MYSTCVVARIDDTMSHGIDRIRKVRNSTMRCMSGGGKDQASMLRQLATEAEDDYFECMVVAFRDRENGVCHRHVGYSRRSNMIGDLIVAVVDQWAESRGFKRETDIED